MNSPKKSLTIVSGPNGSGKTSFIETILIGWTNGSPVINADKIAAGITPASPDFWSKKLKIF